MSLAFCILCQSVPMWFRLCTHSPQSCFHDFPSSTGIQILDQGALCLLHRYAQVIRVQCLVFCKTRWQTCSHSGMQLRIVGISPRISIQTVWMVHHGEDVEHTTHPLPMYGGRRLGYAGICWDGYVLYCFFDVIWCYLLDQVLDSLHQESDHLVGDLVSSWHLSETQIFGTWEREVSARFCRRRRQFRSSRACLPLTDLRGHGRTSLSGGSRHRIHRKTTKFLSLSLYLSLIYLSVCVCVCMHIYIHLYIFLFFLSLSLLLVGFFSSIFEDYVCSLLFSLILMDVLLPMNARSL